MTPADAHLVMPLELGGDGPRVVVKDVIDIAGLPTRAASRAFANRAPATAHAAVVERLLAAGCRIVGKGNLHELAFGMTGVNGCTGTPVNPRFPHLVPGGSSSGSATAVAAGLCDWSLGTDTGGSIRVPAACCGIVGFKPTFGRLSRAGLIPAASSLDCVGPLARDAATAAAAMAILDPEFRIETLERRPRIGLLATDALQPVSDATATWLRRSGCELVHVELTGMTAAFAAAMTVMNAEMHQAFGTLLETGALGPDVDARLRRAAEIPPAAVRDAEDVRSAFTAAVDDLLTTRGLDALATPTLPGLPVPLDEAGDTAAALAMSRLARPFNLSGHPAITSPAGEVSGAPVAVQLVGRRGNDALLCSVACWLEQQVPSRSASDQTGRS